MANEPYNLLARYQMLEAALRDSRLTKLDCSVLAVILAHVDEEGEAWPGFTRMTDRARCSRRTVIRATTNLEAAGYLRVNRELGRVNTYRITDQTGIPTSDTDGTGLDDDW